MRRTITALGLVLMMGAPLGCSCDDGDLGQLVPVLARDVDRLAFPDTFVGGSRALALTLTNAGTANVRLDAPVLEGDGFDVDQAGTDGAFDLLAPGQKLTLEVRFTPLTAGEHAGTLAIDSDGGDVVVVVDGTGLLPLDCDDGEECTTEFFDPQLGVCVRADRSGDCDDDSACTTSDRCFAGSCVGDAVVCADDVDCTLDVCDPARGCVFVGDDEPCADDDPCSLDVCDPNLAGRGCRNPPAPDGTPCGTFEHCVSVAVCLLQECTAIPVPEGSPCSDGDLCTADDACAAGTCAGVPSERPPEVVSETFRIVQPDAAVVVGDVLVIGAPTMKLVPLAESTLAPSTSIPFLAGVERLAVQRGGTRVAGLGRTPGSGVSSPAAGFVVVVDLADPAAPVLVGSVPLPSSNARFFGASQTHAFVCSLDGALTAIDLVTLAAAEIGDAGGCGLPGVAAFDGTRLIIAPLPGGDRFSPLGVTATGSTVRVGVILRGVSAPRFQFLDGTRSAGFNDDDDGLIALIDLDDDVAPRLAVFDAGAVLGPAPFPIAVRAPWLYFTTPTGLRRVDISDIDAPVLDGWRVDVPLTLSADEAQQVVLALDDERLVFVAEPGTSDVAVASVVASAITVPVFVRAQRPLGMLVDGDGDGLVLSTTNTGLTFFTEAADRFVFIGSAEPAAPVLVVRLDSATVFSPLLHVDDSGPLGLFVSGRRDLRAPVVPRDARSPGVIRLFAEGQSQIEFGFGVAWPERVSTFHAPIAEGCLGAALAQPDEPDGVDGAQPVLAFSLSVCSSGVDVVPVGSVVVPFDRDDLDAVSSVQHGDRVSFIGADEAVLVDIADPLLPVVIASVELPELAEAVFASAGADADAWVLAFTYLDGRASRVLLYDVAAGAVLRPGFDDTAPELLHQTVRKRVLAVRWPRAFLTAHDVDEAPGRGWSIEAWDLASDPPVVVDRLPVAGEPVDLLIEEERLIVSRADGLTIVSPPCGP